MEVQLAVAWESEGMLRTRARETGSLTTWPSVQATGVPSMKACSLNARLLELTCKWWTQFCESPASIPIGLLRAEAWFPYKRDGSTLGENIINCIHSFVVKGWNVFWVNNSVCNPNLWPTQSNQCFKRTNVFTIVLWFVLFTHIILNQQFSCLNLASHQVRKFRELAVMDPDQAATNMDGWGVKRLFSHLVRRWLSKSAQPRESW